ERVGPASPVASQGAGMVRLAFFSLFLGVGVSSVNSHLALFSTSTLGVSSVQAGALVAILGAAGVVGRIFWTGRASRWGAGRLLTPLAAGAVLGPVLLWASPWVTSLVWVAALFVGGLGVAANAVSMVSVITRSSAAAVGSATAVVSAGFFAGYAVGPPVLGALAGWVSYQQAWWWGGLPSALAAVVMAPYPRKEPRGTRRRAGRGHARTGRAGAAGEDPQRARLVVHRRSIATGRGDEGGSVVGQGLERTAQGAARGGPGA